MTNLFRKNKLLAMLLMLFLLVVTASCSSGQDSNDVTRSSELNVSIDLPKTDSNPSIKAITDEFQIQNIEVTITNQADSNDTYTDSKDVTSGSVVFEFSDLTDNANYDVTVSAKDENAYTVYKGSSSAIADGSTVDVELELEQPKNLIVNLANIPAEAASGKATLLPTDNNLEAAIDIDANKADFSDSSIATNQYDLSIKLMNSSGEVILNKTGFINIYPGRITNTTLIDLSNSEDYLGEIGVIWSEAPDAPTNLVATESDSIVELNWQGSANRYQIYRGTSEISKSLLTETTGNSYTDNDVTAGETYYYWVRAVDSEGLVSDFSNVDSVDIPGNGPVATQDVDNLRIYQVMVSSFQDGDSSVGYGTGYGPSSHNGDLRGIINSLDYIKSLGMNAIWMTPIFNTYASDDRRLDSTGYFTNNYFEIDPNFGSEADFRELVTKAHELGMYVFLDGVFGHHNDTGDIPASPNGNYVDGKADPVSYPGSLEFYKDVATYWIKEYGIDGWRLDQAYQVYQNGHNYWKEIREAVEAASQARKDAGEKWGTLGYMVGEIWDGSGKQIASQGYSQDGLKSCFDFPLRYKVVQVLATQEHTEDSWAYGQSTSALDAGFNTPDKEVDGVHPNLMLTNHDLVRFGDLIQRAPNLGYGKENPDYWKRYKAALSFMAAYTGPITIYYGDEIGREVEGFVYAGDLGAYDDNASRDNGKTSGFDSNEANLHDYVVELMKLRAEHPALWNGTRTNLVAGDTQYADLKSDPDGSEKIVYVLNTGTSQTTIQVNNVGGSGLKDLLTGATISGSGSYSIPVDGLTGRFLLVQ